MPVADRGSPHLAVPESVPLHNGNCQLAMSSFPKSSKSYDVEEPAP